ncbi:MAG: hypothetical protein ABSG85_19345, partial [Spirochaetia bacterium]
MATVRRRGRREGKAICRTWLKRVAPSSVAGSCSESRDKPRLHFRKDALERNGRDVVAFIHDNVSIASHKVSYAAKANQAL